MQTKTFNYILPIGMSPEAVIKCKPELEYALGGKCEFEIKGRVVTIRLFKGSLPEKVNFKLPDLEEYKLGIPIGYSYEGLRILDMDNDSHCFMLVGGNPGTGKSNFLNQVIYTIIQSYTPAEVLLVLIDLKLGAEFSEWENYEHVWHTAYDPETRKLEHVIQEVNKRVRSRMKEFNKAGVRKIEKYNALPDVEPMPYIFMIIDEFAELHDKAGDDAEKTIKSLFQLGRAAGLRAIVATQRPTVDNISGSIKALCTDRLCFKVADALNSRVILDKEGAEDIPDVPGRAIFLSGAKFREIQTMFYE